MLEIRDLASFAFGDEFSTVSRLISLAHSYKWIGHHQEGHLLG